MDIKEIESFLISQRELLEKNNLRQVYKNFLDYSTEPRFTSNLTEYLLEKFNPLEYTNIVPKYYLFGSQIETIDLQNVVEIESEAFGNCENLTFIEMPRIEVIKSKAFEGCYKLKEVRIAKNCKVEEDAFPSSTKIIEIERKR